MNGDVAIYIGLVLNGAQKLKTKRNTEQCQTLMKRRYETIRSFDWGGRIDRVSNDNYISCMRKRQARDETRS